MTNTEDLPRCATQNTWPRVHSLRRETDPEPGKPHPCLEKAFSAMSQRGPRNQHGVGGVPRRHPEATLGRDKLINHNYYLWRCQPTGLCHETLVAARKDES